MADYGIYDDYDDNMYDDQGGDYNYGQDPYGQNQYDQTNYEVQDQIDHVAPASESHGSTSQLVPDDHPKVLDNPLLEGAERPPRVKKRRYKEDDERRNNGGKKEPRSLIDCCCKFKQSFISIFLWIGIILFWANVI